MAIKINELPGWKFQVIESSAGVYSVLGHDKSGRNIKLNGIDPDSLLTECKKYALQYCGEQKLKSKDFEDSND